MATNCGCLVFSGHLFQTANTARVLDEKREISRLMSDMNVVTMYHLKEHISFDPYLWLNLETHRAFLTKVRGIIIDFREPVVIF